MNTEAFLLSLIMCAIGLALAFVFLNPWGFVLDGLGIMVFFYAIRSKEEGQYNSYSSGTDYHRKKQSEDDWAKRSETAMDAIREKADYPHYEKAKAVVFNYQKENYSHPELVLESKLRDIMATGKTLNEAIDELYEATTEKKGVQ